MQALVVSNPGRPPSLETRPEPEPGAGQVLLKVTACGLNFADLLMIEGRYQESPPVPFIPGMEVAGVVAGMGSEVEGFRPGQRVAAFCGHGGLAQSVVVDAARCRPLPQSMDDVTAAAFQIAFGTSHLALTRRAMLQRGETLVVLGAAGGVGLTAVEIGKVMGARVIAVASGSEKLAVAEKVGADILIDSAGADLRTALIDAGPINVVFDAVGGRMGEQALRALAPEGRYLVVGFASGDLPALKPNHLLVKNITVIGFYWGGYLKFRPETLADSLSELMAWHAAGRINPHVSHVLPFARVEEGLELLRSRKSTGKVVITL
jgi:NADPH:quinone reductase